MTGLPIQVYPVFPPQVPSGLSTNVTVADGDVPVVVVVVETVLVEVEVVGKADEDPMMALPIA